MNKEERIEITSTLDRITEKLSISLPGIERALDDIHELEVRMFKGEMKEDADRPIPSFEMSGLLPQVEEYIERVNYLISQIAEHKKFFI